MRLFPDAFQVYLDESGRLRTPASVTAFRSILRRLQQQNPTLPVNRFTAEILTRFCFHGDHPSPATVYQRRAICQSFFSWCEYRGLVEHDPSSTLKYSVQSGKNGVRPGVWLSEADFSKVLRACPDDFRGRRDRILLMFGGMMGLRRSNLANLQWSQLSPDLDSLSVAVKGTKLVSLGVPPQLTRELVSWRHTAPSGAIAVVPPLHDHGMDIRMLEPDWSTPLRKTGVLNAVRQAGDRVGIHLTPHDLRRSCAGILEDKGLKVQEIQRLLCHENVGTTDTYLNRNPRKTVELGKGMTFDI